MLFKTKAAATSLSDLFREQALLPARCIHHATDLQRMFCSPGAGMARPEDRLEALARRVVGEVAPAFKKAGVDTYWVWTAKRGNEPGFYFDELPAGDESVRKYSPSSFSGSVIDDMLRKKRIGTVIISGVYANHCVWQSARGSLDHGYRTVILSDCVDIKNMTASQKNDLRENGAVFATAPEVLGMMRASP